MTTYDTLRRAAPWIALLLGACGAPASASSTGAPSTAAPSAAAPAPTAAVPSDPSLATIEVFGDREGGSELWIDGARHGPLVDGMQVQLAPGEHSFEARRGGVVVGTSAIRASAGDHGGTSVIWEPLREPAAPTPEPPRAPGHVALPTTVRESGDGEFDPAVVVRVFAREERALDDCYEIARGVSPDVSGSMTVSMVVRESGSVAPVRILDGTIGDTGDACVQGVIEHVRFNPGPLDGPMTYELTLGFAPDA